VCLSTLPRKPLGDVARELGVDRHTVERAVISRTGKTFRQLQHEAVVARAVRLLNCEPARSVKEVALLLGYTSASAFSRALRRDCGESPTEIRTARVRCSDMWAGENLPRLVNPPVQMLPPPRCETCQKC